MPLTLSSLNLSVDGDADGDADGDKRFFSLYDDDVLNVLLFLGWTVEVWSDTERTAAETFIFRGTITNTGLISYVSYRAINETLVVCVKHLRK